VDTRNWRSDGDAPDPRWSLANERTLLAYSRTALGLLLGGLAVAGSHTAANLPVWVAVLGLPLVALGGAVSIAGRRRFSEAERAMKLGEPMRAPTAATLLALGIFVIAAVGLLVAAIELATSR
jgi:putative membrane protein